MATLYVAEFNFIGGSGNRPIQGAQVPPINEQTVAIGVSSVPCTTAFNNNTNTIRVACDTTCSISFGAVPVATTSNMRLASNQTEYFSIPTGQSYKVAVIANT